MPKPDKTPETSSAQKVVGKLPEDQIKANFTEMHPPLTSSQAQIESSRCYFCYEAPCIKACPTDIDIPEFIKRIQTDNLKGSARKILEQNIMGGMCARVCPTEVLCEGACVRNTHEDKPVAIGLLQRYATEEVIENKVPIFERLTPTDQKIAVIGAGPAGLSCAHGLAAQGHNVTIFEKHKKAGGLNEYGIAAYKVLNDIAQKEVDYIMNIGGIKMETEIQLGSDFTLDTLRQNYHAVFIGIGLSGVKESKIKGEEVDGVIDAIHYIRDLRQADMMSQLPVGDKVVVIGGGMTAIDIAVQSKKLGASEVTIAYRRNETHMKASQHEQQYAQINDVKLRFCSSPKRILSKKGQVTGIEFDIVEVGAGGTIKQTGKTYQLEADVIFKAIGQTLQADPLGESAKDLVNKNGRIEVNDHRKTALDNVWAGGDCVSGGEDLTVCAVQDGKVAAQSIHAYLRSL
jgi:dihydropyrimidine dehydrogenase (NAD+) subunit PreT